MRELELVFKDGLTKGLRPSDRNPRNSQFLVQSDGMIPDGGGLRSVDEITLFDSVIVLGESFPFPQVHIGQTHTIVFGQTRVWEYVPGHAIPFALRLSGLVAGDVWTVADFHEYIVAANGQQTIRRNATDGLWEVVVDEYLPVCQCVAAVNGQLIVGSPDVEL